MRTFVGHTVGSDLYLIFQTWKMEATCLFETSYHMILYGVKTRSPSDQSPPRKRGIVILLYDTDQPGTPMYIVTAAKTQSLSTQCSGVSGYCGVKRSGALWVTRLYGRNGRVFRKGCPCCCLKPVFPKLCSAEPRDVSRC